MKKITSMILSALLGGAFVLSSCGSGNSSSEKADNKHPLGDVPGIFVDIAAKETAFKERARKHKDIKSYQKALNKHHQYVAEKMTEATEKGKKLIGGTIPCIENTYPDFQVTEAKITDYHGGDMTGSVYVHVIVTPQRDIIVRNSQKDCAEGEYSLKDTRLYYALMKDNDFLIKLGQINPFSHNASNMNTLQCEYIDGQMIQAGVPCHSEGSPIFINCHSYDFSEFAKIVFLTEKSYTDLHKQFYGF